MKTKILLSVLSRKQAILPTAVKRFLGVGLLFLSLATQALGQQFEVDGIMYTALSSTTVSVTNKGMLYASVYSGDVIIPPAVTDPGSGVTYDVTLIGDAAFAGSSLTSITIPNSVTTIERDAFAVCSLTSISIHDGVTSVGAMAFTGCVSLASITLPNGLTSIGDCTFTGCSSLTSITIPNSVTSIGGAVFNGCSSLTSITIPNSVTSIGGAVFHDCGRLTSVVVEWSVPIAFPVGVSTLGVINYDNCTLIVPPGTKELYEAADVWKNFGTITDGTVAEEPATEEPTEEPVEEPAEDPTLSVDTDTITFDADDSHYSLITVTAYSEWEALKDSSWIIFFPDIPCGNEPGSFIITVATNPGVERKGKVIVTNGTETDTIYVIQAANPEFNVPAVEEPTEEEPAVEEPTEEPVEEPTAEPAAEEPATEEPTEEEPAAEEPTEEEPTEEEPTEEEPAVEESATEESTEEEPTEEEPALSVNTDTITFKADESLLKPIKITTKLEWEIITDVDWISFIPKTSGTGDGELLVVAESNDGEERETTITVATEADSAYIYVSQAAGIPSYALHFEAEKVYYYSPDTTISTDVEVVAPDAGIYAGTVVIPSTATYSGKDYAVTTIGAEAFAASDLTKVTLPLLLTAVGDDAFKDCAALDSVEILWTSLTEAYPDGISYAFDGVSLRNVTLTVPAGMKDIYKVAHFWGAFGTILERERESTTSTAKATEAVTVRAASGKLYINSPIAETVYIYSFNGKLLYTATKASGLAIFDAPSEKLLIVRGTSGWARKLIN